MVEILQDTNFYDDTNWKFTWLGAVDPESVSPITQAYGFCFDENGELLVIQAHPPNGTWQVPGGTVEVGETLVDTLRREIVEEANTTIKDIQYLGVQKVENDRNDKVIYQARFCALVDSVGELKIDPDKGYILPRKFIPPSEYRAVSRWGVISDELVRLSLEKINLAQ